jgi:hypothetical protein
MPEIADMTVLPSLGDLIICSVDDESQHKGSNPVPVDVMLCYVHMAYVHMAI